MYVGSLIVPINTKDIPTWMMDFVLILKNFFKLMFFFVLLTILKSEAINARTLIIKNGLIHISKIKKITNESTVWQDIAININTTIDFKL
jgi:hypothetical protein